MKIKAPVVSLEAWRELCAAARMFDRLKPWEMLGDQDLIGVRNRESGETGYACVMGGGGTLFGLCLYRGPEGFDFFRRLLSGDLEPEADEFIYLQNCLKLELGAKTNLEPGDMKVIKSLGCEFKGKNAWPQFRSLLPGYVPWFLEEGEARLLRVGLFAAAFHMDLVMKKKARETVRQGEVLVYTEEENGFSSRWEPWPIHRPQPHPPVQIFPTHIQTLVSKAVKRDDVWEASTFIIPAPITQAPRPYFGRAALVTHAGSGFILNSAVYSPLVPDGQNLADVICAAIDHHSLIPTMIRFDIDGMAEKLSPLSQALGIRFEKAARLPSLMEARTHLVDAIRLGRFR